MADPTKAVVEGLILRSVYAAIGETTVNVFGFGIEFKLYF